MALEYATISGKILDPTLAPFRRAPIWIEAATADGIIKDTVGNRVLWSRKRVNPDQQGNYTVTLPKLPQADVSPGDARWRLYLSGRQLNRLVRPVIDEGPDPIEFELTDDTTWDELVDVSGTPVSESLVAQMTALRDETVAAAGAVDFVQTRLGLRPFYEQLAKRDDQRVTVMMLGDSITEGAGVGPPGYQTRSIGIAQQQVRSRMGQSAGGNGYMPARYAGALLADDTTITGLNSEKDWQWGPGGKAIELTGHASTPGEVVWPASVCTKVRVYFGKTDFLAGNFKVFIDDVDVTNAGTLGGNGTSGASGATVSCVDAGGKSGGYYWESATLTAASHTVKVRSNTAGFVAIITAAQFFNSDTASGVHLIDGAHTGAQTHQFLDALMDPAWEEWATHAPDLTIVNLGVNDATFAKSAADYQADLTSLVGKIKTASPAGTIMVVHGWRAGTIAQATWDAYRAASRAVVDAEPLAVFLDLEQWWPTLLTDGSTSNGLMWESTNPIHPNAAGHQRIADIYTDLLVAGGAPAGGGGGGASFADDGAIPSGGAENAVAAKNSGTSYDLKWLDLAAVALTGAYGDLTGTPTLTDASSLTTGQLNIERLTPGSVIVIDKAKSVYGAAGSWPASRPTARTDIVCWWIGDTDPGVIALAGDIIDLVG